MSLFDVAEIESKPRLWEKSMQDARSASLKDLLKDVPHRVIVGSPEMSVAGIAYHSKRVEPGYVFVALKGRDEDGHEYIAEALARQASAVVLENVVEVSQGATVVQVDNSRLALSSISAEYYGHPSRDVTLVGITGTNGKTTVAYLVDAVLRAAGCEVGVLGTIGHRFSGRSLKADITTPESLDLQRMLREMADSGVTHAVMEVSSHALDLFRVAELHFDVGVFTNLSRDHLDYHGDMADYFAAKKSFFTRYIPETRGEKKPSAVLFLDDPRIREIATEIDYPCLTFGFNGSSDISLISADVTLRGSRARIKIPGSTMELRTPLLGNVNLLNHLAAAGACLALGIDEATIEAGLNSLGGVPGRLERVDGDAGPTVLVDYAHTPDGLENVLMSLRSLHPKKLICVFGCGGDRDRGKRPEMGSAAAKLADLTIVTSDNPRSEDPLSIIEEIEAGIRPLGMARLKAAPNLGMAVRRAYAVEPDRRKAIELAVTWAVPGEVVLIAGKGHEDYQIVGDSVLPFDDVVEAGEALRSFWGAL